jgi:hypothetical protein
MNGDGLDDLIVGAHQANLSSGKSYVVFGKQDTNTIELSAIAAGTGGFVNWRLSNHSNHPLTRH